MNDYAEEKAQLAKIIQRLKESLYRDDLGASDLKFEIETAVDQLEDVLYYLNAPEVKS